MNKTIIVLGNAPDSDVNILRETAQSIDPVISIVRFLSLPQLAGNNSSIIGCLSFLPCEKESMIRMFSSMPLGMGREIPFYQKIDGSNIPDFLHEIPVCGVFCRSLSSLDSWNLVNAFIHNYTLTSGSRELMGEIIRRRNEKHRLIKIGTALSSHNNLNSLLSLILAESRDLSGADAGSVYMREKNSPGGQFINTLRFKISQNDSVDVTSAGEFVMPINHETIAGYVASAGEPLTIDDVYDLPSTAPYKFGRDWDKKLGYRVKSMLTIPLKNMAGEVVGVLQLMNKKKDKKARLFPAEKIDSIVTSFTVSDEEFMASIGSQAAVSIERVQLYGEIEAIFEGYLKSSMAAIDERDRITSGHSWRVMGYAMALADAINAADSGPFRDVVFSEQRKNQFRFAALLHDIGKIGVPEALLMKETKLSVDAMAVIKMRVEYIKLSITSEVPGNNLPWKSANEIDDDFDFIENVNKSGFLTDEEYKRLASIGNRFYFNDVGDKIPFLSNNEWEALSVRKGNLTGEERERINSHAIATRRILSRIPWIKELEGIPEIACHHHERIDGSGYPDKLVGDKICLESRALAIIDIFEALVAQDRPYKPKMSFEQAISILKSEAQANHLDSDIVEFFIKSEIYKIFSFDKTANGNSSEK